MENKIVETLIELSSSSALELNTDFSQTYLSPATPIAALEVVPKINVKICKNDNKPINGKTGLKRFRENFNKKSKFAKPPVPKPVKLKQLEFSKESQLSPWEESNGQILQRRVVCSNYLKAKINIQKRNIQSLDRNKTRKNSEGQDIKKNNEEKKAFLIKGSHSESKNTNLKKQIVVRPKPNKITHKEHMLNIDSTEIPHFEIKQDQVLCKTDQTSTPINSGVRPAQTLMNGLEGIKELNKKESTDFLKIKINTNLQSEILETSTFEDHTAVRKKQLDINPEQFDLHSLKIKADICVSQATKPKALNIELENLVKPEIKSSRVSSLVNTFEEALQDFDNKRSALERIKMYQAKMMKQTGKSCRSKTQDSKRRFKLKTFNFMENFHANHPRKGSEDLDSNIYYEISKKNGRNIQSQYKSRRNSQQMLKYKKNFASLKTSHSQKRKIKFKKNQKMFKKSDSTQKFAGDIDVEKFLFQITSQRKKPMRMENPLNVLNIKSYSDARLHPQTSKAIGQGPFSDILGIKKSKILASKGMLQRIDNESINKNLRGILIHQNFN
ncbi:unnamed protein product [Moneuplotes crassus]|uniref:Uncharacterized protein n=1 Tax=Euplotes crassus TaxID=5936 RepID=A0AAD1Y8F3_EUPCR|nr:unnamed protein product [Moneuplotes crassus]